MSIQKLGLKNFRVFKEQTDFDLAPITVFTGPNNSGKSSAIKALILLAESARKSDFKYLMHSGTKTGFQGIKSLKNDKTESDKIEFKFNTCLFNDWDGLDWASLDILEEIDKVNCILEKNLELFHKQVGQISLNYDLMDSNYYQLTSLDIEISKVRLFSYRFNDYSSYVGIDTEWFFLYFNPSLFMINKRLEITPTPIEYEYLSNLWKLLLPKIKKQFAGLSFESRGSNKTLLGTINSLESSSAINLEKIILANIKNKPSDLTNEMIIKIIFSHLNHLEENFIKLSAFFIKAIKNGVITNSNYLPTYRQEPLRLFNRNDNNILSNMLFDIYDNDKFIKDTKRTAKRFGTIGKGKLKFSSEVINTIFGIGESLMIKDNSDNSSIELRVIKKDITDYKNIADMGFGTFQLITLLLSIELAIIDGDFWETYAQDADTGQSNKISNGSKLALLIEEPEISLHPNYQSKLADVFALATKKYGVNFIIETHSEYLIEKLKYLTVSKQLKKADSVIYYLHDASKNIKPTKINIKSNGTLTEEFGEGFLDHSSQLILDTWNLRGQN